MGRGSSDEKSVQKASAEITSPPARVPRAHQTVFETLLLGTRHGNEAIRLIYEENQKTLSGYAVEPVELIERAVEAYARSKEG